VYRLALWLWKTLPIPRFWRWATMWLLNTKFLVGVVGVIFDQEGRVLLVHHTYRRHTPWGLPGGWVGANERLEEALARELREETGYQIEVIEIVHTTSGYRRPQLDLYFLCEYQAGEFSPNAEIDALHFYQLDALPTELLANQRAVIERAQARWRERQAQHSEVRNG
jgi:ADP-ribose pyrophosphatase YjhB (NUDIX family)